MSTLLSLVSAPLRSALAAGLALLTLAALTPGCGSSADKTSTFDACSATSCPSGCCARGTCVEPLAQDWSACGAPGLSCGECTHGATCVAGTCSTYVDPRAAFWLVIDAVQVRAVSPSGLDWDGAQDPPDPFVCVDTDGVVGCTSYCPDTTHCRLGGFDGTVRDRRAPLRFDVDRLQSASFTVYDLDGADFELMGSVAVAIDFISSTGYELNPFGGVERVWFHLEPAR